jgi:CRP-like cAMP-binding protein
VHLDAERIRTLATGTFFGEISLLTGQRRNATVRAITTCDLFVLDREEFQLLLEQVIHLIGVAVGLDSSLCFAPLHV